MTNMKSLVLVVLILATCSQAFCSKPQQAATTLSGFFEQIITASNPKAFPSALDTAHVFEQIPAASPNAINQALPNISLALQSHNTDVQKYALVAIVCIDQRPDSANLLRPITRSILSHVDDPDPQVAAQSITAIYSMRPRPPAYVIPKLVEFLSTKKARTLAGPAAVFALARLAYNEPAAASAIVRFMQSKDMPTELEVDSLNALAFRSMQNPQIVQQIVKEMSPSETQEVRLAAINAIKTIGPFAYPLASEQLNEIVRNTSEPAQIRSAAQNALSSMQ